MYYPVIFEPIYKQLIWGGERLRELFGRTLPFDSVGESWDISCRPGNVGIVRNGKLKGMSFAQLIEKDPEGFLGKVHCEKQDFPLLIKLIDANADLSVQVHPPGEKNEVWYIIHADEGAKLNAGLIEGTSKEDFVAAIGSKEVERYLNFVPVKAGDVINIPTGTVHAICSGLVLAEIQQNSDTTYRVYDYGRVDALGNLRQLHIEESIESINFDASCKLIEGETRKIQGSTVIFFCKTEHYALYEYIIEASYVEHSDPDKFFVFTCIGGSCEIISSVATTEVTAGDSVFIPAGMGKYEIRGSCRLLKSFAP